MGQLRLSLLRLIARLDIKGPSVVKGLHFEGLRVVGKPAELAREYASEADELLYIDTVATLYGRNQLCALLEETTNETFIPCTAGGGLASKEDAKRLLDAGADKVALNSAALRRPDLVNELSDWIGSQAVVVSIEARRVSDGWEAYCDNGRERSGKDAVLWAIEAVKRGAGELLVTSIDRDGTMRGMDCELIAQIAPRVPVPVTAGGGCGTLEHARSALRAKADALAIGAALHYGRLSIKELRNGLAQRKLHAEAAGNEGRGEAGPAGCVQEKGA